MNIRELLDESEDVEKSGSKFRNSVEEIAGNSLTCS